MRKNARSAVAGTLCVVMGATSFPSEVFAGPMSMAGSAITGLSSSVEPIHYRSYRPYHHRRYYRRYRYGYDPARAMFAAAALGIMGAGLAAATRPHFYGWGYPYYGYGWGYPWWGW